LNLSKIAIRYATALLEAAETQKSVDAVTADLSALKALYADSAEFKTLIHSPTIQLAQKEKMISDTFKNVNTLTLTFLTLLAKKNRLNILTDSIAEFERLIDLKSGIVHAEVTGSVQLTDHQLASIKSNLEEQLNVTVNLSSKIDEQILGGYVVRVNDTMIDHSIKNQLAKLKDNLLVG
jgi:F-type H+-transporting ATPase subunit delta